MPRISGWGRYPVVEGDERLSEDLQEAVQGACLTRGLGRSYGDASLPPGPHRPVAGSRLADRILLFDAAVGRLRAEAGTSLARLNAVCWRRGWTSPVSPGTQFVTLGGMVAADVHGKNHHVAGTFGEHVLALRLALADGSVLELTEAGEPELFRATLGGMGLTGHILEVEFQLQPLPSPWILQESRQVADLDAMVAGLREASARWPFTVCWLDTLSSGRALGRGILIAGRWATEDEAPGGLPPAKRRLGVPCEMPGFVLGPASVKAFNTLYFNRHGKGTRRAVVHPEAFFYPLDALRHWNRLYGRRGFVQYQCVLPLDGHTGLHRRFFEELVRRKGASFLSVVKDCGAEGRGLLSFPRPGISAALDIPMRGGATQDLVDALNSIVLEAGGRIYLAKDALTRPEHFRAMEPRLPAFDAVRRRWDPEGRLSSALAVRLFGDPGPRARGAPTPPSATSTLSGSLLA